MEAPSLAIVLLMIFLSIFLLAFLLLYVDLPTYVTETQKNMLFLFYIGITMIVFVYVAYRA